MNQATKRPTGCYGLPPICFLDMFVYKIRTWTGTVQGTKNETLTPQDPRQVGFMICLRILVRTLTGTGHQKWNIDPTKFHDMFASDTICLCISPDMFHDGLVFQSPDYQSIRLEIRPYFALLRSFFVYVYKRTKSMYFRRGICRKEEREFDFPP